MRNEKFTDEEWEEFKEKWGQERKPQKLKFSKKDFFIMLIVILAIEFKILGVW